MKKPKLSEHTLAVEVCKQEGLKQQEDIAQTKEILKLAFGLLANRYSLREIARVLRHHRSRKNEPSCNDVRNT